MNKFILLQITSLIFSQQLQVDGNLKVTKEIDAQGKAIKNVGTPTLTTDAANAQYVNERTAGKGRIITLKCPWAVQSSYYNTMTDVSTGSCEPPSCPENWNELIIFNEVVAGSGSSNHSNTKNIAYGNTIRLCIEEEE